ncbi:peptidyl-prolyl cis-trans isomerase [bacterium]|nr:peptidyl-prolyl cis-trans isomerase [bacterium]
MRIAFSALVLCLLALCMAMPASAAGNSPVASKDGVTFTLDDLNIYWLRNLGKDGLLDFFQTMVVYQEGLKQGLRPTQQEMTDFVDNTMGRDVYNQFKLLYSEKTVNQLLEYTIVTSKYEVWLRDKISREKNIKVTEAEANKFFLENIEQFHLPEGAHLSIISVDNESAANTVLGRLQGGEDFGDVAAEVNMDPQMRAVRGELGSYRKGEGLPKPLEDAAFSLREGQYSGIIKGSNYHIVYCHRRYPEVSPTFDQIKEQLMVDLREAKIDPYYIDALNELMAGQLPRFNIDAELFRPEE